jgi:hypothetical protein
MPLIYVNESCANPSLEAAPCYELADDHGQKALRAVAGGDRYVGPEGVREKSGGYPSIPKGYMQAS